MPALSHYIGTQANASSPLDLALDLLAAKPASMPPPHVVLTASQRHDIQVMATVTSSISIAGALVTFYWFCMMKRNFRRDLILLLIGGDSGKTLWILAFCIVTFRDGPVASESAFCQLSGFWIQSNLALCGKRWIQSTRTWPLLTLL